MVTNKKNEQKGAITMKQTELTNDQFKALVPTGDFSTESREDFVATGRRMMDTLDQVYLSVNSISFRNPDRQGSVQEYGLYNGEPVFRGTVGLASKNPGQTRQLFETLDSPENPDAQMLEAIVGKDAAGMRWVAAYQRRDWKPGQNEIQTRVYHLKGGDGI